MPPIWYAENLPRIQTSATRKLGAHTRHDWIHLKPVTFCQAFLYLAGIILSRFYANKIRWSVSG